MIKVLNFGDFHIGQNQYSRINPETGLSYRVEDALKVLDEMIDYAKKHKIKVIVFSGDMYKNTSVSDTIQYEVNRRISKAANEGITFLLLAGNHDVSTMIQHKSPLSHFEAMNVPNVVSTRFHKEYIYEENGEKIKFVFIPTYHSAEDVKSIVDNTTYDGFPIVYIMHGTIRGALLNDWLIEEKETYVEADIFDREGVAAVVLGHLHKHQILYNKPLTFYTGSTNRIDFTEEKQEKGFVITHIEQDSSVTYDYKEVNSIKFLTLKDNLIESENPTEQLISLLNNNSHKIQDSIVRLRVNVDKSTAINEKKIYELAYELGAFYVLDIQRRMELQQSVRVDGLNESVTEEQALEMYYSGQEGKEEHIKIGKEIIAKAKTEGKIV